jgi:hypothetical protein
MRTFFQTDGTGYNYIGHGGKIYRHYPIGIIFCRNDKKWNGSSWDDGWISLIICWQRCGLDENGNPREFAIYRHGIHFWFHAKKLKAAITI